jgi:hypothetical protein
MCVISSLTAPLKRQVPKTDGSVQKVKVILPRLKLTEVNQNLWAIANTAVLFGDTRNIPLLSYRVNKKLNLEGYGDLDLGPRSHQGHSLTFPVHH